jgi:hypothetical protein
MEGWIRLHRQFLDNWLCDEYRPLTKREAWENMIFWANFKDDKILIKGQLIECKRGQICYSLETWSKKFNWSVGQVRQFFKLLENDSMIMLEGMKYTTRLTICNYESYQETQQTYSKLPTNSQQQDKKDKKKKEVGNNHLFKNSPYYNNLDLIKKDIGERYLEYNLFYYQETMRNWADSKGIMRKDWISQLRNFILRDIKDGKPRMK